MPNNPSWASLKKSALSKLPAPVKALIALGKNVTGPAVVNIGQQIADQQRGYTNQYLINQLEGTPKPLEKVTMNNVQINWKKVGNAALSFAKNAIVNAQNSPTQQPYGYNAQSDSNSNRVNAMAQQNAGTTPDAPTGNTAGQDWKSNPIVLIGGLAVVLMLLTKK